MENILVVGGCGYVGGFLVDLLNNQKDIYNVVVYDNLFFESRYLKEVDFVNGDVMDESKLSKLINKFDVVIWLAGIVGDGACSINPKLTTAVNVKSVKWLADNFTGKIIFPSTCSVYGANNNVLDEASTVRPLSLYAETKLEAEKYILENAKKPLVFRLGTLYGLSDNFSRIRLDLVVNILTKKAAFGEPLSVFGGEQWRPLLHVHDVAHAMLFGLKKDLVGLFNLSEGNYKIIDIANKIKKFIPSVTIVSKFLSFEDSRNYKVDNNKIKQEGWQPLYNIDKGIQEMIELFNSKRIKNFDDPVFSNVEYMQLLYKNKSIIR